MMELVVFLVFVGMFLWPCVLAIAPSSKADQNKTEGRAADGVRSRAARDVQNTP